LKTACPGCCGAIEILYKDHELEPRFAKRLGVPLPLANLTQQVYQGWRAPPASTKKTGRRSPKFSNGSPA